MERKCTYSVGCVVDASRRNSVIVKVVFKHPSQRHAVRDYNQTTSPINKSHPKARSDERKARQSATNI